MCPAGGGDAALLAPYPWDYVLGSIHYIGDAGIDGEPALIDEVGVEEAWRRYYETLAAAASSGLFDSLAHPDLVRMYGPEIPWDWAVAGRRRRLPRGLERGAPQAAHQAVSQPGAPAPARARGMAITLASTLMSPRTSVAISTGRSTMRARRATRP